LEGGKKGKRKRGNGKINPYEDYFAFFILFLGESLVVNSYITEVCEVLQIGAVRSSDRLKCLIRSFFGLKLIFKHPVNMIMQDNETPTVCFFFTVGVTEAYKDQMFEIITVFVSKKTISCCLLVIVS